MKKFEVADVQELNINETANGWFNSEKEICIFLNDSKKSDTPEADS